MATFMNLSYPVMLYTATKWNVGGENKLHSPERQMLFLSGECHCYLYMQLYKKYYVYKIGAGLVSTLWCVCVCVCVGGGGECRLLR